MTVYYHKFERNQENIIHSIDQILNNDSVWEDSLAARFVSEMKREMQDTQEWFNTQILSLLGSRPGQKRSYVFHPLTIRRERLLIQESRATPDSSL
jgi:hypothetical protein